MKFLMEPILERVNKIIYLVDINDYFFLVVLLCAAVILTLVLFLIPYLFIYQFKDEEKQTSYECGFQPFEDTRHKFDIKYYLVAILFIIFDIEIMVIVPWVKVVSYVYVFGTFWLFIFLFILVVGFVYEWHKGALSWS